MVKDSGDKVTKREPTMFKAKGQKQKFYVNKAIQDYIKAEAELATVINLNCVDTDKLNKMKDSVKNKIESKTNELTSYLTGKTLKDSDDSDYMDLLNSIGDE